MNENDSQKLKRLESEVPRRLDRVLLLVGLVPDTNERGPAIRNAAKLDKLPTGWDQTQLRLLD
jgi:hypothetical protein